MEYDSGEMNRFISGLGGDPGSDEELEYNIEGYTEDSGKVIPYIGWIWRGVPFDEKKLTLGSIPGGIIGFMENNKWEYDEWETTEDQRDEIVRLIHVVMDSPSDKTLQALFDYIQTCKPKWDLKTEEEYRAEERAECEKEGRGPPIYFPDAMISADEKTYHRCPNCRERKLWQMGSIMVCYCGYQSPTEKELKEGR